ncbi:hypothetical protein CDL60_01100 [Roseateles noduli]|nr:hypothetical protein CDL60_01100 [Roseateles noduli]
MAIVTRMTIRPGTQLPVHHHPYPRVGWVEQGALRVVQTDSREKRVFFAGSRIVESIGRDHHGEVVGNDAVVLTILDVVPPGVTSNTVLRDDGSAAAAPASHDGCPAPHAAFQ